MHAAATLAALGCRVTSAEVTKALIALWRRQRNSSDWAGPQLDAFAGRDSGWLADAGRRVAAAVPVRRPVDWAFSGHTNGELYRLARGLLWMAGAVPETDDGFVLEWALTKWRRKPERTLTDITHPRRTTAEESVAKAFRADPYTAEFLPRVFDITGFGTFLSHPWHWRAELIALSETGELPRAPLIDRCVDGLLRGGRVIETRGFQKLLDEVEPTEDELAERAHDWAGLAGHAEAPSAGRAVESLRRTPGDSADLLPAVAIAFGYDDTTVQEQAWKLTARHLGTAGETVRTQLIEALPRLAPDLRERAAAALGAQPTATDSEPPPVVVSSPRPTAAAPGSASEAVQEIAALLAVRRPTALDRERAVDGLIRAAYRDRAALAEHLAPVVHRQGWIPGGLNELLRAVLGEVTVEDIPADPGDMSGRADHKRCIPCLYDYLLQARWHEAARRLLTEPVPFLLATPGWSTGALDAAVLVERLTEYTRLGLRADHTDLDQALLRTWLPEPPERDRLATAAAGPGTPDGTRLAHWLNTGGVHAGHHPGARTALPVGRDGFTVAFRHLDQKLDATWHFSTGFRPAVLPELVALVPVFREYLADQLTNPYGYPVFLNEYLADLPLLVEADGPAGPRLNMVFASAIAGTDRADRPAVVDALLQASARGDLDEQWCGEQLGRWTTQRDDMMDVAPVLTEAARAGAYRLVWAACTRCSPPCWPCRPAPANSAASCCWPPTAPPTSAPPAKSPA
ncbi:DUF6493 family protein [Actinoplanes derwentensis]|uniref:Uncharacterized protein n=1 Tax=Actinoplanes derwentensis TaxID=113562 RepID=A0A1H2C8R2_9ACTN|nr:DUF6493 family protein [Actinoplanes derwentensis]GID88977.1 hypothetical protein Ade03nite_79010 [Actinoplanes derwentensis]SDT66850.1 hypothetical protein SAMN04489716_5396 [Actinoplanes derwentensis]